MRVLFAALCALAVVVAAPARAQTPPPAAAFGRLPAVQDAEISPDGKQIAILGGLAGQRVISLAPIDGVEAVTIPLGTADVKGIRWAGDRFILAEVSVFDTRTSTSDGRKYAYNFRRDLVIDTSGAVLGLLLDGASWAGFSVGQTVIGLVEGDRPTAFVRAVDMSGGSGTGSFSRIGNQQGGLVAAIWEVDVANRKGRMVVRGNDRTGGWDLDLAGKPRVRWDFEDGQLSLYGMAKGASTWKLIDKSESTSLNVEFLGYSDPDDAALLRIRTEHGARIIRHSLADGSRIELGPEKPAASAWVMWDERRLAPVAIVSEGERSQYQWLDPQLGAVHAKLSKAFRGRQVTLANWSADRSLIVVRVEGPDSPPAWFLFDTRSNQASALGEEYPELAGVALGKTSWITYKAADGLEIPAYLTLPAGLAPGQKPPLIVMPHGGPASRDDFEFDWWSQFLAARGYAVLRPQYRGSTGFGVAFERAGFGEWGGRMQTDLTDGVAALAAAGTIDAQRVCIVGASYGGFAALFGATRRPDVYRCAVSVAGISDLMQLIGHARVYQGAESATLKYFDKVVGDSRTSEAALFEASPAKQVGPGTAPILLIHGEEDTTVPIGQSRSMELALRRAGKPAELVVLQGDDHYLSSSVARTRMLEAMAAFLDKHLPVGP